MADVDDNVQKFVDLVMGKTPMEEEEDEPEEHRMTRYEGLLPIEKIARAHVMVVGVGAIGRQVALQLAHMGVGDLTLIDHDTVSVTNLGTQGWHPGQIDTHKVQALRVDIYRQNPDVNVEGHANRFDPGLLTAMEEDGDLPTAVFMCVDNMEVRKEIFDALACRIGPVGFIGDGRMAAEAMQILSVTDADSGNRWLKEWFPQEEAYQEGCTQRSTFYCASIAAGMLVLMWTKHLRGKKVPYCTSLNLQALDMTNMMMEEEVREEVKPEVEGVVRV